MFLCERVYPDHELSKEEKKKIRCHHLLKPAKPGKLSMRRLRVLTKHVPVDRTIQSKLMNGAFGAAFFSF